MMQLEKQVCSLDLAKRLKELGVKQESFWAWYETTDRDDTPRLNRYAEDCGACTLGQQAWEEKYAAFTVAELGEMLPWRIETSRGFYILKWEAGGKPWHWISYVLGENEDVWTEEAETEADARAKMVIYLVENKLVTL